MKLGSTEQFCLWPCVLWLTGRRKVAVLLVLVAAHLGKFAFCEYTSGCPCDQTNRACHQRLKYEEGAPIIPGVLCHVVLRPDSSVQCFCFHGQLQSVYFFHFSEVPPLFDLDQNARKESYSPCHSSFGLGTARACTSEFLQVTDSLYA